MRWLAPAFFVVSVCVSACAQSETAGLSPFDPPSVPAPAHAPGLPDAVGLVRAGADIAIPEGAKRRADGVPRDSAGRPYSYEGLGQTLPAFSGQLADGGTFHSADLAGRWTVIEVWGLWCHDSRNDLPYAAALSRALAQDPDVDFMTIHTPQSAAEAGRATGKYASVAAYFDSAGYRFRTVLDGDASLREQLQIRWTPSYLVVGPDLTVRAFRTNLADAPGEPVKDFVREISALR